jgi:hypothetical protein
MRLGEFLCLLRFTTTSIYIHAQGLACMGFHGLLTRESQSEARTPLLGGRRPHQHTPAVHIDDDPHHDVVWHPRPADRRMGAGLGAGPHALVLQAARLAGGSALGDAR